MSKCRSCFNTGWNASFQAVSGCVPLQFLPRWHLSPLSCMEGLWNMLQDKATVQTSLLQHKTFLYSHSNCSSQLKGHLCRSGLWPFQMPHSGDGRRGQEFKREAPQTGAFSGCLSLQMKAGSHRAEPTHRDKPEWARAAPPTSFTCFYWRVIITLQYFHKCERLNAFPSSKRHSEFNIGSNLHPPERSNTGYWIYSIIFSVFIVWTGLL